MARLTFKKWFEHYKPDEETTTILANGYTQITEREYEPYIKDNYYLVGKAIDKLAEYEDLEEQGLLLKLPCKVGETIFEIVSKCAANQVEPEQCDAEITCAGCKYKRELVVVDRIANPHILMDSIFNGRKLFTTREEAEAALQRMQEDKQ